MKNNADLTPETYLPIAIAILNVINETIGWGADILLEKNDKGYHLDLSNAPYQTLTPPREAIIEREPFSEINSILMALNLYSLNLSGSQIRDLEGIKFNNSFSDLIIEDMVIYDQPAQVFWLNNSGAKRIFISKGMFSPFQLGKLDSGIEVILN